MKLSVRDTHRSWQRRTVGIRLRHATRVQVPSLFLPLGACLGPPLICGTLRAKTGSQLLRCTQGHKNVPLLLSKSYFTHLASDFLVSAPAALVFAGARRVGPEAFGGIRRGFRNPRFSVGSVFSASFFFARVHEYRAFLTSQHHTAGTDSTRHSFPAGNFSCKLRQCV